MDLNSSRSCISHMDEYTQHQEKQQLRREHNCTRLLHTIETFYAFIPLFILFRYKTNINQQTTRNSYKGHPYLQIYKQEIETPIILNINHIQDRKKIKLR